MTQGDRDLIERLRDLKNLLLKRPPTNWGRRLVSYIPHYRSLAIINAEYVSVVDDAAEDINAAADRLQALSTEVERLKEALLKSMRELGNAVEINPSMRQIIDYDATITLARQALKGANNG